MVALHREQNKILLRGNVLGELLDEIAVVRRLRGHMYEAGKQQQASGHAIGIFQYP